VSLLKRIEQVNALGDETPSAPGTPAAPAPVRPLAQVISAPPPTSGLTGMMGGGSGAAPTTVLANPGGGTRNLDGIAALRRPVGGDLDQFTELRSRVQDKLIAEIGPNVDPSKTHEMRKKIQQLFDSILETEGTQLTRADRVRLFEQIVADILGFGPIQPLLDDESVSEVMVNGPKSIYVERKGKLIKTDVTFQNDDHVMRVIDRIISPLGRRCDESSPMVDARLPDGSRVNAIIPPLSLVGPVVTIRKFSRNPLTTDDLVNFGTLTPDMVAFLKACVEARLNVLVSGGTGSGKTTLLNVLSSFIPDDERIVTIEDSAELQLRQDHVVTLESRPANVEGKGRVAIRELVINALRMRPERIVVGECRGAEALDMLQAMNTGHDGACVGATRVQFVDGTRRIGEVVDSLIATYPGRVERRFQHGVEVEYVTAPLEARTLVTCVTADGTVQPTPVVYALRKPYRGLVRRFRTSSGLEHTTTPEHPLYALRDAVAYIPASDVRVGDWLAAPRRLVTDEMAWRGNEEASYWSGVLTGDGCVTGQIRAEERRAHCVNLSMDDEGIAAAFDLHLREEFGYAGTPVVTHEKKTGTFWFENRAYWSASVAHAVAERYALPIGAGPRGTRLRTDHLARSPRHFLAGFFDAEGHVGTAEKGTRDALSIASGNLDYLAFAREALLAEGIPARLRRVSPSKSSEPTWQLLITGKVNIVRFAERVPIRHARKRADLRVLIERFEGVVSNPNTDVVPCTERLREKLDEAKARGHNQRTIATKAGCAQRLISMYRRDARMPTPGRLEALCLALEELGVDCADLLLLARADLRWERVEAIEDMPHDGYVYDLQVSEEHHSGMLPHNFAADCLLTSNSMTTAHANTPRDLLSRVETMCLMAGMDLPLRAIREQLSKAIEVIVQQSRMKDGTRKVTNITEVQGMEGDVIVMQDIFVYEQTGIDENGKIIGRLRPTGIRPKFIEKFEAQGIFLPASVFGADRFF